MAGAIERVMNGISQWMVEEKKRRDGLPSKGAKRKGTVD
jgi:hypothetical protein